MEYTKQKIIYIQHIMDIYLSKCTLLKDRYLSFIKIKNILSDNFCNSFDAKWHFDQCTLLNEIELHNIAN